MLACMREPEAGAHSSAECEVIEVTGEMIEAGSSAAWHAGPPPFIVTEIVQRVYVSMERARRAAAAQVAAIHRRSTVPSL